MFELLVSTYLLTKYKEYGIDIIQQIKCMILISLNVSTKYNFPILQRLSILL